MSEDEELAKDLGPLAALTIGVGTMIGAGIFVLPRTAINEAGSFAIVSFVLGGGIAMLTALSASELGTAMPKSGGAYYYINHALGPLFGSIAGWANWIGLASAFYMVGFGRYITSIFGIGGSIGIPGVFTFSYVTIIALVGAAFFTTINYVGAKETGRLQNVIVTILVAILAAFTLLGSLQADPANLPDPASFGDMMTTTGLIFVSYLGFVQITSVAEEIKEPGKNLPRAVIGSVVLVTAIYALVLLVMSAAVEPGFIGNLSTDQIAVVVVGGEIGRSLPAIVISKQIQGAILGGALLFGGLLATASSANASILASSRINFAMGRDRILTPKINEVHPRFGTPYRAIGITGILILTFIAFGELSLLASTGSALHLIIYGLLNVALIVMRVADPEDYQPEYTVPLYPIVPILGAITSFALMYYIAEDPLVLSLGLAGAAVVWYLVYARNKTEKQGILGQYILERSEDLPDAAVSAATSAQPDGGRYRVMVPLANPENQTDLITLAAAIAKQRNGTVVATHIVQVPDQTSLEYGRDHLDEFEQDPHEILDRAQADAETFGVDVERHVVLSHRSFEEVFDAATTYEADLVVMGWGPHSHDGRAESAIDELTETLPCDFLVLRDRGFDPSRILVPTAGGPDSDLSAAVAAMLRAEYDAEVRLLYVLDDDESRESGERFLAAWANERDLGDADLVVREGDVERAIQTEAAESTMLIIGATERGLLSRLVRDSLALEVVDDVDCSVLLAERSRKRSLRERLFGTQDD